MSPLYRIAIEWGRRAFGNKIVNSIPERALRIAEEAIELCQVAGVPINQVYRLATEVYNRPEGELHVEMGGVLNTAVIFCMARGWDPDKILEDEICRVLNHPLEKYKQRMQEKIDKQLAGEDI